MEAGNRYGGAIGRCRAVNWSCGNGVPREQLLARCVTDRNDRRVLQLSLDRDRIEAVSHVRRAPDPMETLLPELALKDGGNGKHSPARLSEGSKQRIILKLPCNCGSNAVRIEPQIQATADGGVLRGYK